ncbi:MAG: HAD-IA family hydrolase [Planctomycetes bacterium]|nr:HAD-IA family hydrolase [Planctomycetota bacterium]
MSEPELHGLPPRAPSGPVDTALFDLDGTLIDSIELIRQSYAHTLRVHRNFEPPLEFWIEGLGRPLRWQFAHFSADSAEIEAMVATYRAYNLAHHDAMIRAFDGAVEAVAQLKARGVKLGIVTSKMHAGALRGLKHCGFEGLFDAVIGADNVDEHKPHPAPVRAALAQLGASAERAVMVGDSPHDLSSGRAAGAFTAAVAWGPFPPERLLATAPDYWLETPREIAAQFLAARG